MNSVIESIFIGVLQGLLEWLPISSEGNMVLILVRVFGFQAEEVLSTVIFLHLGTGLAALLSFRNEVIKILLGETEEYADLRLKLFLMTMLTGLIGFPLYLWLNISASYGELIIAITGLALIITGLIQRQASKQKKSGAKLSWPLSVVLGGAQGLAIIPGLSRSGLTTSIMFFRGFSVEEAFSISFLMSIPVSFASAIGVMFVTGFYPDSFSLISITVATVVGYIAINVLLRFARQVSFWKICIGLGALALLAWLPNLFV